MHRHIKTLKRKAKQLYLVGSPAAVIASNLRYRTIKSFAEKNGLVYFGAISQVNDDHRIVRGVTASISHKDRHCCIGTIDGHDVVLLERSDNIKSHTGQIKPHAWLVLEIDLDETLDIPHIFFGTRNHSDIFYQQLFTTFSYLRKANEALFNNHSPDFMNHYSVFCNLAQSLYVESLFTVDITKIIGSHFHPLAIEAIGNTLYIYADNQLPSQNLLNKMLKNGMWLAGQLNKHGK